MVETRRFGAEQGAAGVVVLEQTSPNVMSESFYGTTAVVGWTKRGPMGVPVRVQSLRQYSQFFGDPADRYWHLFAKGDHLLPDWVDDYLDNGGGAGTMYICRLPLEGARPAEITLKNRMGSPALRIVAANEGRWAGASNSVPSTPVVVATARTFTLHAPGAQSNEFEGAKARFSAVPNKEYAILTNTAADPESGEAVFTVGAQYNLILDGVSGPAALAGTASYARFTNLTGTIAFPATAAVTGTVKVNGKVITGTGTAFSTELAVGSVVYLQGEARVVESITSDTTLTLVEAFTIEEATNETLQQDNLIVTGTGTAFDTALSVGDTLYVVINGALQGRKVAAISSATVLTLESGYTEALTAGTTAQRQSYTVTGTGTSFNTELGVGQYLIDPNRQGETVKVVAIASATSLTVDRPFSANFTNAQLTKQVQSASVEIKEAPNAGLSVRVGQGQRYPETHFSLAVYFRGLLVLDLGDCSLDPNDNLFVERLVEQRNLGYSFDSKDYFVWCRAESLWTSDYTTNPETDARPANGYGKILAMSAQRIYTVADMNYESCIGEQLLPNPYRQPRAFATVKNTVAPITLTGTIASNGVTITGTSTLFTSELKIGDYLYDPGTRAARRIRTISSSTSLTVETTFPSNIAAGTKGMRAGYLQVEEAYDLNLLAKVDDRFIVSYAQGLAGGYDGDKAAIQPYHYSRFANGSLNLIEKAVSRRNMGLVRIYCPGVSDIAVQKQFMQYASLKSFEFRAEIPSSITTAAAAESFVLQRLGRSDFIAVNFPSYGYVSSPNGIGFRMVSLSGAIAGGESRRALANRSYAYIYSGIQANLPRVLKLPATLEPADESILNRAGIQQVLEIDGNYVVFGGRIPSQNEVYTFLHVRRIQSHLTRVLLDAKGLMEVLFLPNQPGVLDQIVLILEQLFREEYRKGTLTKYLPFQQAVEISSDLGGQAQISEGDAVSSLVRIINGRLEVTAYYVPTGIIEILQISTGPQILVEQFGQFS